MEYVKKFFENIGGLEDVASFVVYVIIAMLFVFGFLKCVMPVIRNRNLLNRATRSIKSGNQKRSWQEDGFLGKGSLFAHWSEYLNNLFFADGVYHNASNVEDYINEDTVIYGPGSSGFSDALPGLMVSMGFMGTLIGLAMGLSGFDMGDETAIMTSIETLIPSMRYAFMTSIIGVIASVSFSLITRFVHGSASRAITNFYGAMSRYAGVLSVDPLTQVAIYQQEQTALIQTMAKDLNGQFTQRMAGAIKEAVAPINDSLTRFVTVNTQEQMRFLDTVVTRFVSHMDQALGNQFHDLSNVIDRTVRNQEKLLNAVEVHVSGISRSAVDLARLEKSSAEMLERLDGYMNRVAAAQKAVDDAYMRVSGNFEQMQLVSRQQADYLRDVSNMENTLTEAMEYVRNVSETMKNAAGALENACAGISGMKAQLDSATENSAKQLEISHKKAVEDINDELARSFNALADYMRQYNERIDETTQSIANSVGGLPAAVERSCSELLDQVDRMGAALNRAQRAMDDAVDRMYGN